MTDADRDRTAAPPRDADPYDSVPYESYAYDFTEPQRLRAIGRLVGMAPPDVRTARVLELGCASGGNIVPLAARYDQATFVGVDLSQVHIREARGLAEELDLHNVTFHRMSIEDITPQFGVFDYIIAHGVFSWVPEPVREAIIRVAKTNLAPDGMALISYNTLPGWNQVRAVRDMMVYHCARFATLEEKIAQGIALLRFVLETAPADLTAYRESVQSELALLTSQRANYIFHDHLERENYALHLHEMAAMARARGLDYVADTNLASTYLYNFPAKVAEALAAVDDIVRIEQYLDFITNRRFRTSVFCHDHHRPQRHLEPRQILDFHIGSLLVPPPAPIDLSRDVTATVRTQGGLDVTGGNRYANAVLGVLAGLGMWVVPANEIIAAATQAVGGGAESEERVRAAFVECGLRLVLSGALVLHSVAPEQTRGVSERPLVFAAARAISRRRDVVPNVFHASLPLDPASRTLLQACDGVRDHAALVDEMMMRLAGGELSMSRQGVPVTDVNAARRDLEVWVDGALKRFAELGLLVG